MSEETESESGANGPHDWYHNRCRKCGQWFREIDCSKPCSPASGTESESGIATLRAELLVYLDYQKVNADNIGNVRRACFVPWDSKWNAIVREETAKRELPVPASDASGAASENPVSSPPAAERSEWTTRKLQDYKMYRGWVGLKDAVNDSITKAVRADKLEIERLRECNREPHEGAYLIMKNSFIESEAQNTELSAQLAVAREAVTTIRAANHDLWAEEGTQWRHDLHHKIENICKLSLTEEGNKLSFGGEYVWSPDNQGT